MAPVAPDALIEAFSALVTGEVFISDHKVRFATPFLVGRMRWHPLSLGAHRQRDVADIDVPRRLGEEFFTAVTP